MPFMPIFLAIGKQLDGLPRFHYQIANVVHKQFFLLEIQTVFGRQDQYVPIRIVSRLTTGARTVEQNLCRRIRFVHILLYLGQHRLKINRHDSNLIFPQKYMFYFKQTN